jgi:hypothetical protein
MAFLSLYLKGFYLAVRIIAGASKVKLGMKPNIKCLPWAILLNSPFSYGVICTQQCCSLVMRWLTSPPLYSATFCLQISSLKPLVNNPHYRNVLDMYLDENHIHSIESLEGADWLLNFRVLSLRSNQLTQVPTYALDNALQRNRNAVIVHLGNNPWICDCLFTPTFQVRIEYIFSTSVCAWAGMCSCSVVELYTCRSIFSFETVQVRAV